MEKSAYGSNVHVGFKMQGKCVFIMEHIGYFTFGMHWITYFYISMKPQAGTVTSGSAHLTHSSANELNGLTH